MVLDSKHNFASNLIGCLLYHSLYLADRSIISFQSTETSFLLFLIVRFKNNQTTHAIVGKIRFSVGTWFAPPSTPDFSGNVGLNLALDPVTSCYSCQTTWWRPACSWLGCGSMSIDGPSKSSGAYKKWFALRLVRVALQWEEIKTRIGPSGKLLRLPCIRLSSKLLRLWNYETIETDLLHNIHIL